MVLFFTITSSSYGHECDNIDDLPTPGFLRNMFGMIRQHDGSYTQENPFQSLLEVIEDPLGDSQIEYTSASTVNTFMVTSESNPNRWCYGACEEYDIGFEDEDLDDYELCWEECKNTTMFEYGVSYFHRLPYDETFHFYMGDTMYIYELDGSATDDMIVTILGSKEENGEVWSYTIPAGTWFAVQVNPDSESVEPYAVGSVENAPSFEFGDYELAELDPDYDLFETTYPFAWNKIQELSFDPTVVTNRLVDDPYAETGMHSLCVSYSHEWDGMTLEEVKFLYQMDVFPKGGFYTPNYYESSVTVRTGYGGDRSAISNLYFAMNDTIFFHKQDNDETYHYYHGESVVLYEIDDEASPRILRAVPIGDDVTEGEIPHYSVRGGNWIALTFKNNNMTYWQQDRNSTPYALFGISNAPGYVDDDFEFGEPEGMKRNYPEFATTIQSIFDLNAPGLTGIYEPPPDGDINEGCNMTGINLAAFNVTGYFDVIAFNETYPEMADCLNTTDFIDNYGPRPAFGLASESNFATANNGVSQAGRTALWVFAALACAALLAFVVVRLNSKRRHRNKEEAIDDYDENYCPPDSIVICERGGQVDNLETVSVSGGDYHHGRSRRNGSVGYVDFSGKVHAKEEHA